MCLHASTTLIYIVTNGLLNIFLISCSYTHALAITVTNSPGHIYKLRAGRYRHVLYLVCAGKKGKFSLSVCVFIGFIISFTGGHIDIGLNENQPWCQFTVL